MKPKRKSAYLKQLRNNVIVWLKYRTLRPNAVRMPGCKYLIEVDPDDRRARTVLTADTARGKISRPAAIWRAFNTHIQPDVAIDVGVNYGECLFGTTYSPHVELYGFEANPKIFACLQRSRLRHPNSGQFTLHNTLIAASPAPDQQLYVDPNWSGTASAVAAVHSNIELHTHTLPVRSLDSLLPHQTWQSKCILFKIDIEGYEAKAMSGFSSALNKARKAVGILEFDSDFLIKAGDDPAAFVDSLRTTFHTFCLIRSPGLALKKIERFSDIPVKSSTQNRVHTDLILIKRTPDWDKMLPPTLPVSA